MSGLWSLCEYLGYDHVDKSSFFRQMTLRGVRRLSGSCSTHRDPFFPEDLINIFGYLGQSKDEDLVFWAAVALSFRCLLHKSHVTTSCHSLRVSDLVFQPDGLEVIIQSSKTDQYADRSVCIPVLNQKGHCFAQLSTSDTCILS